MGLQVIEHLLCSLLFCTFCSVIEGIIFSMCLFLCSFVKGPSSCLLLTCSNVFLVALSTLVGCEEHYGYLTLIRKPM